MNKALVRRILLERIYDEMSDEDKRLFVMMTMQDRSAAEIMRELRRNQQHLEKILEHIDKDRWYIAFGSDVAANVLTTATSWLIGRLLARK